jgi:hypothetical protein
VSLGPPITTDLAEKALNADVRNALQDVAKGDMLPPSKRDLLFGVLVSDATAEEIWQAHQSALLKKFAQGGRLTAVELERIAHLLPAELAPFSKIAARATYKGTYAQFATTYGKCIKTIKNWVSEGKKAEGGPDLPPFDDPLKMPDWWGRVMKIQCPESIKQAARKAAGESAPPKTEKGDMPSASASHSQAYTANVSLSIDDDRLHQIKEQLARARLLLLEAQNEEPQDAGKIEVREKKWRELRKEVDAAEEADFKLRTKRGKTVDLDELAGRLLPMLVTCRDGIRSASTRVRTRITPEMPATRQDEIWNEIIDECFAELIGNGFLPVFKLTA